MLIHVGYHKTATTFLQKKVFSPDSRCFLPIANRDDVLTTIVSPHDFDFDLSQARDRFRKPLMFAEALDKTPVISCERLSGSPHAGGHDSLSLANRLKGMFPDAKILIVIREQYSAILSAYAQYVKVGGGNSLKNYLSLYNGPYRTFGFSFSHFCYHRLINAYYQLFGRQNVLVLPYELFKLEPGIFMSKIASFNGISSNDLDTLDYTKSLNPSLKSSGLTFKRHCNRFLIKDSLNPSGFFSSQKLNQYLWSWAFFMERLRTDEYKESSVRKSIAYIKDIAGAQVRDSNKNIIEQVDFDIEAYGYDL